MATQEQVQAAIDRQRADYKQKKALHEGMLKMLEACRRGDFFSTAEAVESLARLQESEMWLRLDIERNYRLFEEQPK